MQFDSQVEYLRYLMLRSDEEAGRITGLTLHPQFVLIDKFKDCDGKTERAVKYTADFQYVEDGRTVVEDVKSAATKTARDYPLRRKLFKHRYPHIRFVEVEL